MSDFNERFAVLSDDRRRERYRALAAAALERYALGEATVTFVGHNAGVTYRVETPGSVQRFLFKIAEPIGEGGGAPERSLCAAALSNLSFQITIPSQRTSPGFARNVREFASVFCRKLAASEPFVLA